MKVVWLSSCLFEKLSFFSVFQYDNILMEEAAQILEIETFIPLLLQVRNRSEAKKVEFEEFWGTVSKSYTVLGG